MGKRTPAAKITSFGYGHAPAPEADIVIDARRRFRDPHTDPAMRELTGLDPTIYRHVLATPGVRAAIGHTVALVRELTATASGPVTVAVGCTGGRHRAVAMTEAIAGDLSAAGLVVRLTHRDVTKPLIRR
ncbi:RapZ C-terminal domain-containing protein [Planomonospora parontospora]|uniref:RapZ C-terminal domain-containing protein n=1 Tax=Planomonospora parontospora TaxID=58119 RepID=UPI00166F896D|nr:RNase adapter RapZ [Planomonospora parontospora]GGL56614.1 hypothetical protein GCM10014719_67540 [Planomonospora parontospora subsp. antibiotica]GII19944.1 hypothetical protein Ppa05_66700 [Planomonospora parontospora subsp. antibiotica]